MPPRKNVPTPPPVEPAAPEPVIEPVIAPPTLPADAGAGLYRDCAGSARNTGLTEGSSNFETVTAAARAILPE